MKSWFIIARIAGVLTGLILLGTVRGAERTAAWPRLSLPGTEVLQVAGRPAFLYLPSSGVQTNPIPWVFYAPTLPAYPDGSERWMFQQLLQAGVAIAGLDAGETYGSPKSLEEFDALYAELTGRRGLAKRLCLLGRSRGGLFVSNWAISHPERMAGIAGIYPVFDLRSYPGLTNAAPAYGFSVTELEKRLPEFNPIDRVQILARARIPVRLIHGDADVTVPLERNSGELVNRYREAGAESSVRITIPHGEGHNVHEVFFHSQDLVDFMIERARAGAKP